MSTASNDIKRVIQAAQKAGWRVERGRHWRLYSPDPQVKPLTLPLTPGKGRAMANSMASLRRAGLKV